MTTLWRISNHADLLGIGGLRAPARWHNAGRPIVYLAEHPALALLEILVHLEIRSGDDLPTIYRLLRIEVDDEASTARLDMSPAPVDWRAMTAWTRAAGSEWLSTGTSVLLEVPSVIVPFARNYLMNPLHSDASHLHVAEVLDVQHDPRILKLIRQEQ
ncbi:Toxin Res (plasmid) [Pararobbsia alpina]|uniref:RES family NAD+ phosphorylase n=1 Tax=Pararobbsia alpina TaxID=621374 RepID=UPI0039A733E5